MISFCYGVQRDPSVKFDILCFIVDDGKSSMFER